MPDQIRHGVDTYGIDQEATLYSQFQVQDSTLNYRF